MNNKRLIQEYKKYQSDKDQYTTNGLLDLYPTSTLSDSSHSDLTHWKALIKPSPQSHYRDTIWILDITIPPQYPSLPPIIKFDIHSKYPTHLISIPKDNSLLIHKIPPPHLNINFDTGEICLDILKDQWTPLWDLKALCVAVLALLNDDGDLSSPLNVDLLNLVNCGDLVGVDNLIRYYIGKYGSLMK